MKKFASFIMICFLWVCLDSGNEISLADESGFMLPPMVKSTRSYPKLVNYFHRMDLRENNLPNREEYLAQWDVIILNPLNTRDQKLNLAKIRSINPEIKILAWIPCGQSSGNEKMCQSFDDFWDCTLQDAAGKDLVPPWGGYLMNPYKNNYAWANHVAAFVEKQYLDTGLYDGVMFDCMWCVAPGWYSPNGADVNEDHMYNQTDSDYMVKGMSHLLQTLRNERPKAIITGNGGVPWPASCPYYLNADGTMAENAFGNEFGANNSQWSSQWDYYNTAISKIKTRPLYYFLIADIRFDRSLSQAGSATELTEKDRSRFRLALTTTLLGDGYFGFDRGDCWHGQLWWFDEYNVDLGKPLSGYDTSPNTYRKNQYASGTLSREFDNGTVIVNKKGSKSKVTFPESRRDVSTGETGTSFTIPGNDGRIFIKN